MIANIIKISLPTAVYDKKMSNSRVFYYRLLRVSPINPAQRPLLLQ